MRRDQEALGDQEDLATQGLEAPGLVDRVGPVDMNRVVLVDMNRVDRVGMNQAVLEVPADMGPADPDPANLAPANLEVPRQVGRHRAERGLKVLAPVPLELSPEPAHLGRSQAGQALVPLGPNHPHPQQTQADPARMRAHLAHRTP
ncbi:MAG: hypothetical protein JO082_12875, partial [Mycobacterium sp.]|nr:hypothetical protein [Mycobacterium sp.]